MKSNRNGLTTSKNTIFLASIRELFKIYLKLFTWIRTTTKHCLFLLISLITSELPLRHKVTKKTSSQNF